MSDVTNTNDSRKKPRTAGEAGWHASRYNLMADAPDSDNVVIYNLFEGNCAEYSPIEMFLFSVVEELDENHPAIARFARRGIIANFDEREALETRRRLECATARNGEVAITICPTLACNFECPYCFSNRGQGKMSPEIQDDVVAFVGRMVDAARAKNSRLLGLAASHFWPPT